MKLVHILFQKVVKLSFENVEELVSAANRLNTSGSIAREQFNSWRILDLLVNWAKLSYSTFMKTYVIAMALEH